MSSGGWEHAERLRKLHNRPGWLAIAGAAVRLLAYALPWIVIRASKKGAYTDTATVSETGPGDPNPSNNTSSVTTTVS